MKAKSIRCALALLVTALCPAANAGDEPSTRNHWSASKTAVVVDDRNMSIPLTNFHSDVASFLTERKSGRFFAQAASDKVTMYRPIAICRLLDTRGFPAAISGGGPYNASSTHTILAGGKCGIPTTQVAGLSLSFHVFNYTVNNGGYITFKTVGAPVAGTNAVFNTGAQWTAATTNVSTLDDTGNFDIYVAQSQVEVIVDVNGYYADLDGFIDAGTAYPGISSNNTAAWVAFGAGNGGGLYGYASGSGPGVLAYSASGHAIRVLNGTVQASGAGVNTNTFAFIHKVNTTLWGSGGTVCGGFTNFSVIDNPQLNGDANAIVFITPRNGDTLPDPSAGRFDAWYELTGTLCSGLSAQGHWLIKDAGGFAMVNNSLFDILVIKK